MTPQEIYNTLKMFKIAVEKKEQYRTHSYEKFSKKHILFELSSMFKTNIICETDLINYLAYKHLWCDNFNLYDIKINEIIPTSKVFSRERLNHDIEYIRTLIESTNMELGKFFIINADGYNILFNLIKKGRLSPYFYLYFYNKIFFQNSEDIIRNDLYIFNKKIDFLKNKRIIV